MHRLVVGRNQRALQAGLPRFSVADEHQPELVHSDFCTGAQKLQHGLPSLGRDFAGRNGQPLTLPRVMTDAGGGRVIEVHDGQLHVVEDAGYEAAHSSDTDFVPALQNSISVQKIKK